MGDVKEQQATPTADLETQIMSACVPKNEREWWAQREIERLRQQLTTLQAEKERLEGELGRLREYRELAQKYIGLAKHYLNRETNAGQAKRLLQECSMKMKFLDEHPTQEPTNGS